MQPYFFPYIEYFRLIAACDLFVFFDSSQFSRGTWMSRNRILNREKDWVYFGVPIASQGRRVKIKDAKINQSTDWRKEIFDKLRIYQDIAPNYENVTNLLYEIFSNQFPTLADLNTVSLERICGALDIDVRLARLSEMSLELPEACAPGEWALEVCKAVGATEYWNPSGGRQIYDPETYRRAGIELSFHEHIDFRYDTGPFEFVPDLSIVDALMWVGAETVRDVVHRGDSD